jgi:hypothetical protein
VLQCYCPNAAAFAGSPSVEQAQLFASTLAREPPKDALPDFPAWVAEHGEGMLEAIWLRWWVVWSPHVRGHRWVWGHSPQVHLAALVCSVLRRVRGPVGGERVCVVWGPKHATAHVGDLVWGGCGFRVSAHVGDLVFGG